MNKFEYHYSEVYLNQMIREQTEKSTTYQTNGKKMRKWRKMFVVITDLIKNCSPVRVIPTCGNIPLTTN